MEAINTYQGAGIHRMNSGDETMEMNLLSLAELTDLEDGKATLSDEKIAAFVNELDAQYSTRYRERTFQSTLAGEITIDAKFNDYGYTILVDDEIEQLREDIESRKVSVEREPVYLETNSWGNPYYLKRKRRGRPGWHLYRGRPGRRSMSGITRTANCIWNRTAYRGT